MKSCIYCVEKHLALARVYLREARSGYPGRVSMGLGELAAAEEESEAFSGLQTWIRQTRKELELTRQSHSIDWEGLFGAVESIMSQQSGIAQETPRKLAPADVGWPEKEIPEEGAFKHVYTELGQLPLQLPTPLGHDGRLLAHGSNTSEAEMQELIRALPQKGPAILRDEQGQPIVPVAEAPSTPPTPAEALARRRRLNEAIDRHANKTGCGPCELKKLATEYEKEDRADLKEHGEVRRVVIIAVLADFNPSYSLSTCVQEQARALSLHGYRVTILVQQKCDLSQARLPESVRVRPVLPLVSLREDEFDHVDSNRIQETLLSEFRYITSAAVICHDLIHQSWNLVYAHAVHALVGKIPAPTQLKWYHVCHSMPGPRPEKFPGHSELRWALPVEHRLLAISTEQARKLVASYRYRVGGVSTAAYGDISSEDIVIIPNSRDICASLNMSEAAERMARVALKADVIQVYPVSATRLRAKGVFELVALFAKLDRHCRGEFGKRAVLILAVAHANGPGAIADLAALRASAEAAGLPADQLIISSEEAPETATHGLSAKDVHDLFAVSNLFVFPSVSEASPLCLMEARQAGCFLVVNRALSVEELLQWAPYMQVDTAEFMLPEKADFHAQAIVQQLSSRGLLSHELRDLWRLSVDRLGFDLAHHLRIPPYTEPGALRSILAAHHVERQVNPDAPGPWGHAQAPGKPQTPAP